MISAEPSAQQPRRRPAQGALTATRVVASVAVIGLLSSCKASMPSTHATGTPPLLLVSYTVTRSAFDRILPRFQAQWKAQTGEDLAITASYGGSGSQTRAVIEGLDADLVALALAADVQKLEQVGLIKPGWQNDLPLRSMITNSTVAFMTRKGNPKQVHSWTDLGRPGVQVVTANPKISGGARWNFLALWGSVSQTGGSEAAAENFVTKIYSRVKNLPKSARKASDIFLKRDQGDVLLNYENEAFQAARSGELTTPYLVPTVNIRIEGPIAVVDRNVDRKGTRKAAEALALYLQSDEAQTIFAEEGFRPVSPKVWQQVKSRFPTITTLFSIDNFGGWQKVNARFFSDQGIWNKILSQRP